MRTNSFEQPDRSEEEQRLQERVIELLENKLLEQENVEVFTNPGVAQNHPVVAEETETLYPDLFTVSDERVTSLCAVETPSSVSEASVDKWNVYSGSAASFFLVLPENKVEAAESLMEENSIHCDKIIIYQETQT